MVLAGQSCKEIQTATAASTAEKKILGLNTVLKPAEYTTIQQQLKVAHGKFPPPGLPGATSIEQLDETLNRGNSLRSDWKKCPQREKSLKPTNPRTITWEYR